MRMKQISRLLAASALAALLTSCTEYGVFEDVGVDPHPPAIQLLSVTLESPAQPAAAAGEPSRASAIDAQDTVARTVSFDAGGLTVRPGANTIVLKLRYSDVGGDVVKFQLRDRDSGFNDNTVPEDLNFFAGTSGELTWAIAAIEGVQEGPHRLEVWAEDSRESRSEKVEFTINVLLF
jgi:hypothetical protein